MKIEIKCTKEQKLKINNNLAEFEDEVTWNVIEYGSISDEDINVFGRFAEEERKIIKEQYSKYPEGFFPNPMCALY